MTLCNGSLSALKHPAALGPFRRKLLPTRKENFAKASGDTRHGSHHPRAIIASPIGTARSCFLAWTRSGQGGEKDVSMAQMIEYGSAVVTRAQGRLLVHDATYQAYQLLHIAFIVAPIIAGVDKFFHVLVDWDLYL